VTRVLTDEDLLATATQTARDFGEETAGRASTSSRNQKHARLNKF